MSRRTKIWFIIATSLVIIGSIIFAVVMTVYNWDFTMLSTVKYETNTYKLSEEFSSISIKTDTADILLATSDDEMCRVVCYETETVKHSVNVQDGKLAVNVVNDRRWYEYIGITTGNPRITVYLPKNEYTSIFIEESTGDIKIPKNFKFESIDISISTGNVTSYASASKSIKIKTSTGDIRVENISADMLDLTVSTGEVTVSDVTCKREIKIHTSTGKANITDIKCRNIISNGNTGDITLKNIIASKKFCIKRTTGDVRFDGCDAAEIWVKTDTGDVTGSLLTDKVFITQSDTGSINVPKTVTGGQCEITTDTGDIKITVN